MTERKAKLAEALERLKNGETVDDKSLDISEIAARAYTDAQTYAHAVAAGQAKTRAKLRGARWKG
jgi:hypothetical protein